MRVGFSSINHDEHWVDCVCVKTAKGEHKRTYHFNGPDWDDPPKTRLHLCWNTRIVELESADITNFSDAAYLRWEEHFGSVFSKKEETDESEQQPQDDDNDEDEEEDTLVEDCIMAASASDSSTHEEVIDVANDMDDDVLEAQFLAFDEPLSLRDFQRMAR